MKNYRTCPNDEPKIFLDGNEKELTAYIIMQNHKRRERGLARTKCKENCKKKKIRFASSLKLLM